MSGMSLAGSKSFDELRRKKDLRDELLSIEIANEAENERRIKDYQNPYAPKEVPPQYKTVAEQRADIMKLERDASRMLEDIQIDDTEARKVVSWLREQPDRLAKFVAYGVSIRTEILKKANPRLIDASYIINIIRPILLNSNIALGFTSSGMAYNSLEAILRDYDIDDSLRQLTDAINDIPEGNVSSQLNDLRGAITSLYKVYPNDVDFGNIKLLQLPLQQDLVYKLSELIKKHSLPTVTTIASVIDGVVSLTTSDEETSLRLIKILQRKIGFKMSNLTKDFLAFKADLARSIELSQSGEIDKLYKNTELGVDLPLKEGQRLVNVIKGQPIGEDAYAQQKALITNPSQKLRRVIEYIQDPKNDLHRSWDDAKRFIDETGVRLGEGFLPEEYEYVKSIWVHYNEEYRDDVEQKRVESLRPKDLIDFNEPVEQFKLKKTKPPKTYPEDSSLGFLASKADPRNKDSFSDLLFETQKMKKGNIDKPEKEMKESIFRQKLEIIETLDEDEIAFLYRFIEDLLRSNLQLVDETLREIEAQKLKYGIDDKMLERIFEGTGDLPEEDVKYFLRMIQVRLREEMRDRVSSDVIRQLPKTAPPPQPIMSGSQSQLPRQKNPYVDVNALRLQATANKTTSNEKRKASSFLQGKLGEAQLRKQSGTSSALRPPKTVYTEIKTEQEAEQQLQGFLDELEERPEEEQKALLVNILDHFARTSKGMKKAKEKELIKDFDKGGKREILDFIIQSFMTQAGFAGEKGKAYKPTQFGNKSGQPKNKPLKYGLGKVGRGVEVEPATPYKTFGKFLIHIPSLHDNIANFKYPSKASIPHIKRKQITDDYKEFLKDLLENGKINEREYSRLCEEEKDHFGGIVKGAGLLEHFKVKPPKVDKGDTSRYELLIGEYKAGNNSPVMLKELRSLIIKFMDEGKIKRKDGQSLLVDLSTL